ncbi:MAG: protein kinase domain-containing protein, partial [Thermoanaerobaculia bacterium]
GETLADRIRDLGRLPVDVALRITRDVVDALDAAWERKVIHRDIKPSNILIDRRNRVRVADFGLAKGSAHDSDASLTQSGIMVGSPHYVAPEQAQDKPADFRADFYSIGIMLFHMLAGERPFDGSSPVAVVAKHLHEPMPLLRSKRADVPPRVEQLIQWLTQKDPERRPATHAELLNAIDAILGHPLPSYTTIALPQTLSRRRRLGAILLAGAVAIGATWFITRDDAPPPAARPPESKFVVAVAPFYGPDHDSANEGRVMAALIERAVAQRLGAQNAKVVGIEETKTSVRSHDDARELGSKLQANAVIWGEAFALRQETEIQPHITRVGTGALGRPAAVSPTPAEGGRRYTALRGDPLEAFADAGGGTVRLQAEAPNQIELRKTSASGIGDVVLLLAGIHALENEGDPRKALRLLEQAPRSAETLRYQVQALLQADRTEEARKVLEEAIALDPGDAPSHALLGELHLAANRVAEAVAAYQRADALRQPYTTARGIVFENKLYVKETYRSERLYEGKETESLFLLGIDPQSGRVLERHALPGRLESFTRDGDTLIVTYNSGDADDRRLPGELRLRHGRFDRHLWQSPNYLWRIRSTKVGRVLPVNFIADLDKPRRYGEPAGSMGLDPDPVASAPRTLPDLEHKLRAAIEKDPTQPWHLFFLALTLREQKRLDEANAVFAELVRRDDAHMPYWHFTWMLNLLERLRLTGWADQLYPKAIALRQQIPEPVTFSTLFERLINVSFTRQMAINRDTARGYQTILRARQISGMSPEGEDLVAALWAREHERQGRHDLARHERDVIRRTHAHPFNYLGTTVKVDYALTFVAAAFLALVVSFIWFALKRRLAFRRERRTLFAAFAVLVIALVFAVDRIAVTTSLHSMPLGLSDAIGHPQSVRDFDRMLEARPDDRALLQVAAAVNHFAGNRDRAEELYRKAGVRMPGAPVMPDVQLLARAIYGSRWHQWKIALRLPGPLDNPLRAALILAVIGALPLFTLIAIRARGEASGGDPVRVWLIAFLLAIPLLPLGTWLNRDAMAIPAVGPVSAMNLPNLEAAFPPPGTASHPLEGVRLLLALSFPYARIFWTIVVLAPLLAAALAFKRGERLHVMRVGEQIQQIEGSETPT